MAPMRCGCRPARRGHLGHDEVIQPGTLLGAMPCQLQDVVLQPARQRLEGGMRLFQFVEFRERARQGQGTRFFLFRIPLLFRAVKKL
jgi:hypothetical protein